MIIARKPLQRIRALRRRPGAGSLAWAVLLIGLIFSAGVALNLRQVAVAENRDRVVEAIARAQAALGSEVGRHYEFLRGVAAVRRTVPVARAGSARYLPPDALRRAAGLSRLPAARDALARARDTARPVLSARLAASAGSHRDAYALLLPLYDGSEPDGWLAVLLDRGLFARVLRASRPAAEVALELFEGSGATSARPLAATERDDSAGRNARTHRFEVYGHAFLLRGRTVPGLTSSHYGREAFLVLVLGSLLSALLFALVLVLSRSNTRALRLANDTVGRMLDLEERFRYLAATPVGIFRTDGEGRLIFGNRRWQELTGSDVDPAARSHWTQIVHPQDRRVVEAAWRAASRERSEFGRQFRLSRGDEERWVACRLAPLAGGKYARAGWVGSLEDVTALRRQEAELSRRALHDPLTDLPNRSYFLDRLGQAIERSRRARTRLAVLFVDLDGFKAVNDTVGHEGGDRVLTEVAHRLKGAVRGGDTVARFGGDEFTVLCEDVDGADEMVAAAERISAALAAAFDIEGREFSIDCSIGIAIGFGARTAARELLRTADVAMYEAKSEGGAFRLVEDGQPGVRLA